VDPELAALAVSMPRIAIEDVVNAREVYEGLRASATPAGALDEWAPLVDWADDRLELSDGRTISCRIYRPVIRNALSPALVFFHGGGFVLGDLEQEHVRCVRYTAEVRCIIVSIDYRLAPENPFPAPFDDCFLGTEAVFKQATALGIDQTRMAVGGSSAGACLAAAVALKARDTRGPDIAFQLLLFPALDDRMTTASMTRFVDVPVWDARQCRLMWDYYLGTDRSDVSPYGAPARARDLSGLPAAYVLTAESDAVRDEGLEYGLRLMQAGVPAEIHEFPGTFHGFDLMIPSPEIALRAMAEEVAVLRAALRP